MDNGELKEILKTDIQITGDRRDYYLSLLLSTAEERIGSIGITIDREKISDCMLIEMYAAYLYRQRSNPTAQMSPMLKTALNDRLFSEKMGV